MLWPEAEIKWFFEDLQDLSELTSKKDVLFIIGDGNVKVGSQEIPGVTGKFGLGVQNEAGQRLIEFCQENTLVIENILFQQHKRQLYTWTSPDGQYWNQTDYILCSQRWRSLVGYSPWGHRVGHDWVTSLSFTFQVFLDCLLLHSCPLYRKEHPFWVLVLEGLVGLHRTVELQLLQHYWLRHRLGLPWYWVVCLGNDRDHSTVFETVSKYCISESFVDYDGYSISSKGFLSTVVDIMVIWVKFPLSSPF